MVLSDLFGKINEAKMQNGECFLNDTKLKPYEAAFLCYYHIKFENSDLVKLYISESSKGIEASPLYFHKAAFWLWILGEYINKTADAGFLKQHIEGVNKACQIIEDYWDKDLPHWLISEQKGVYVSNVAIAYGALLSISNNLKSKAQKLMVDIKKYTFEKFLDGGKIVSQPGSAINGDLSIIAVPYALIDAGNQILVESMKTFEKELVKGKVSYSKDTEKRDDLTLLLSWYYAERGEIALSKKLLSAVLNTWQETGSLSVEKRGSYFSHILFAIVKRDIESKDFSGDSSKSILFKHIPCGFENPYRKENYERLPNHPIEGEEVILNLVVEPVKNEQAACVHYRVNGCEKRKIMQLAKTDGVEEHYTVSLGAFKYKDKVEYRFSILNENGTQSESYAFEALKWLPVGNLTGVKQEADNIILQFDGLKEYSKWINLKIKSDNKSASSFEFYSDTTKFSGVAERLYKLCFDKFDLTVDTENKAISIIDTRGRVVKGISLESFIEILCDGDGIIHKLRCNFNIEENEKFFGMGERYSNIQYRGLNLDNYVYNQYRDQGLKTYLPVPFTISSEGYGIYLDTPLYSIFRFGTEKSDILEIETEFNRDEQKIGLILFCGTPKEIVSSFSKITGMPRMVPRWALGLWMSSNNWDSEREVLSQVNSAIKYKIPATVMVLEQWSDEATFYIFNDAQYDLKDGSDALLYSDFKFEEWGRWQNPKGMTDYLHRQGLKLILWQAPVMKYMDGISHAQRDEDERVMLKMGYHVKKRDGRPYRVPYYEWFKGSLVPDFTSEAAAGWWMKKREYLLTDVGIDGFKTDGGECIYSDDTVFSNGKSGKEMRNLYPNAYINSFYDYANLLRKNDAVTFSRAGYTGAQAVPIHWAGDERSTFEAFRASINAGLSSGMSGIVFWGWDIGGFNGEIPTAELYIRSTQMAVFCPVMQYHAETRGEYNRDRTPWNIASRTNCPEVLDIFKKYTNLRMNLLPYIYNEGKTSVNTGIPMMRSMFMQYPFDENCTEEATQYFFGEDLLIAPVIYEGERGREVYLPEGSWCELFVGDEKAGGKTISVKAEIEDIPVYIKENSIIPLNLGDKLMLCSDVGNDVDAYKNLTFLLYVKDRKDLEFIDDLGNSINISAGREKSIMNIKIWGNYKDNIHFILRGTEGIDEIVINGKKTSGLVRGNEIVI